MRALVLSVLLALCTGCASFDVQDAAWYAMHAVDVAQTVDGAATDPCFREGDSITRRFIGRDPSVDGVLLAGVAQAAAYWGISKWFKQNTPKWAQDVNVTVFLTTKAYTVGQNHTKGIRLGGANEHPFGC